MNSVIKANNDKMNRLVNVSQVRRANELDFFTDCNIRYHNYLNSPLSLNPNEDPNLQDVVTKAFIEQAQDPMNGVIARSTRLATDIKNMSQQQIKEDKKFIDNYFKRLDEIQKLGGYLIVAVEELKPENLSFFISNYDTFNINGTNERMRDRNMLLVAGWANLFDYFEDVKVEKGYNFRPTPNGEVCVLTQAIAFDIGGYAFQKYLHEKDYVIDDFLKEKNLFSDEFGRTWYTIYGEVDSTQVENGDILSLYVTDVPKKMDLSETFENGGITINSTLQPQYFLGGTIPSGDPNDPAQDTAIQIPQYKIENNKLSRWFIKPINTAAINRTPAYKAEVQAHIAGLFALASGDISVLSGYTNKNLKIDLPLGMNEVVTPELEKLYDSLSPEGKAGFVGNRYMFNRIGEGSETRISLVDAQKAFMMDLILDHNLDIKLIQEDVPGGPSMVKETLTDENAQGRDLIKALNDNNMPIPDFYKNMLGIKEWQAGMPLYYQKLKEEIRNLPEEKTPELQALIEQYS